MTLTPTRLTFVQYAARLRPSCAVMEANPQPRTYVCRPTSFVETVADQLVALGHGESAINTEHFGPTGEKA